MLIENAQSRVVEKTGAGLTRHPKPSFQVDSQDRIQVEFSQSQASQPESQFCQAGAEKDARQCLPAHSFVPGMSQYSESQDIFTEVDMDGGTEDFQKADQESAAISQRCEHFVLSPR